MNLDRYLNCDISLCQMTVRSSRRVVTIVLWYNYVTISRQTTSLTSHLASPTIPPSILYFFRVSNWAYVLMYYRVAKKVKDLQSSNSKLHHSN